MSSFLYPTQADNQQEWFVQMLSDWQTSKRKYLCFPFATFRPRTLPKNGDFWMYMYYRQGKTDIESLRGKVKFRIHVIQSSDHKLTGNDIHSKTFDGGEKIWFLCDKAEQISKPNNGLLDLSDFEHSDGKQLFSTIRTSIAPVNCLVENIQVNMVYPA